MVVQVVEVESLAVNGAVHRRVVGVGYGLSGERSEEENEEGETEEGENDENEGEDIDNQFHMPSLIVV